MENLEKIKEKIRTIDPEITDELLDLLYEYIVKKLNANLMNLPAFENKNN